MSYINPGDPVYTNPNAGTQISPLLPDFSKYASTSKGTDVPYETFLFDYLNRNPECMELTCGRSERIGVTDTTDRPRFDDELYSFVYTGDNLNLRSEISGARFDVGYHDAARTNDPTIPEPSLLYLLPIALIARKIWR